MRKLLVTALSLATLQASAGTPEQNATCVANAPANLLSPADRAAVSQALAIHSSHMCSQDACEYRVSRLPDGRTLVSLRAARYAEEIKQCVTVYMGRAGVVFDSSGKAVDMWPYCMVAAEELKRDSVVRKEMGYHWCEKPAMRPNNSSKPTPLRGAA